MKNKYFYTKEGQEVILNKNLSLHIFSFLNFKDTAAVSLVNKGCRSLIIEKQSKTKKYNLILDATGNETFFAKRYGDDFKNLIKENFDNYRIKDRRPNFIADQSFLEVEIYYSQNFFCKVNILILDLHPDNSEGVIDAREDIKNCFNNQIDLIITPKTDMTLLEDYENQNIISEFNPQNLKLDFQRILFDEFIKIEEKNQKIELEQQPEQEQQKKSFCNIF